jgi:hypothetical protein
VTKRVTLRLCLQFAPVHFMGRASAASETSAGVSRNTFSVTHGCGTGTANPSVVYLNGLTVNAALAELGAWISGTRIPAHWLDIDLLGTAESPGTQIGPRRVPARDPRCIDCANAEQRRFREPQLSLAGRHVFGRRRNATHMVVRAHATPSAPAGCLGVAVDAEAGRSPRPPRAAPPHGPTCCSHRSLARSTPPLAKLALGRVEPLFRAVHETSRSVLALQRCRTSTAERWVIAVIR